MKVSEIMTTSVIGVSPGANLLEMTGLMVQNQVSGLPVVNNDGELVGMVTEGDCVCWLGLSPYRARLSSRTLPKPISAPVNAEFY